jgi:prepilin peptidase CpaA
MAIYALFIFACAAFYFDSRTRRIPNGLNLIGLLCGLSMHGWSSGWSGFVYSVMGAAAGFMLMLLLYLFKSVGAGDVKLFAALGAIAGLQEVLLITIHCLIISFPVAILVMVARQKAVPFVRALAAWVIQIMIYKQRPSGFSYEWSRIPFMYIVIPAMVLSLLVQEGMSG